MKKVISVILAIVLCFSFTACSKDGVKLTRAQKSCCRQMDDFFDYLGEQMDFEFSKEIQKKDGKILYVATFDRVGGFTEDEAYSFSGSVMPQAEELLSGEDIYIIIYLCDNREEIYRIIDTKLDPSTLD